VEGGITQTNSSVSDTQFARVVANQGADTQYRSFGGYGYGWQGGKKCRDLRHSQCNG